MTAWHGIALLAALAGVVLVVRCIARGHAARDLRSLWLGLALLVVAVPLARLPGADTPGPSTASAITPAAHPDSPEATAARTVIERRCYACHSVRTSLMHAPYDLNLDAPGAIDRLAPRIYRQVVMLRAMPVGNTTHMTEDERAVIARWYRSLPGRTAAEAAAHPGRSE